MFLNSCLFSACKCQQRTSEPQSRGAGAVEHGVGQAGHPLPLQHLLPRQEETARGDVRLGRSHRQDHRGMSWDGALAGHLPLQRRSPIHKALPAGGSIQRRSSEFFPSARESSCCPGISKSLFIIICIFFIFICTCIITITRQSTGVVEAAQPQQS